MTARYEPFLTLTFKGPRFDDHALDLASVSELSAYQKLLIETAQELWREANPGRERLQKGFQGKLVLRFRSLKEGSVAIPIERVLDEGNGEIPLTIEDEFTQAARIIEDAITCAQADQLRPEKLPAAVIPLFESLGKTLHEDEWLEFQTPGSRRAARWDSTARSRIAAWIERTYTDRVDLQGEVTQADVEGCSFTLKLGNGDKLPGKFSPDQESMVTRALQDHQTLRLRVTGRAEFVSTTGRPRKFLETPNVAIVNPEHESYDSSERPIWETILDLASTIPAEELDRLPDDGAENHDRYLAARIHP